MADAEDTGAEAKGGGTATEDAPEAPGADAGAGAEDGAGAAGADAGAAAGFGGGAEPPVTFFPNAIALKTPLPQKLPDLNPEPSYPVTPNARPLALAEQSQNAPHTAFGFSLIGRYLALPVQQLLHQRQQRPHNLCASLVLGKFFALPLKPHE